MSLCKCSTRCLTAWATLITRREYFYCPKNPLCSAYSWLASNPWQPWFCHYLHSWIFSRMSCRWKHTVRSLSRLAAFTCDMQLNFLHFLTPFFLTVDSSPLSWCTSLVTKVHFLFNGHRTSVTIHRWLGVREETKFKKKLFKGLWAEPKEKWLPPWARIPLPPSLPLQNDKASEMTWDGCSFWAGRPKILSPFVSSLISA
jgi:hypothetical protein